MRPTALIVRRELAICCHLRKLRIVQETGGVVLQLCIPPHCCGGGRMRDHWNGRFCWHGTPADVSG